MVRQYVMILRYVLCPFSNTAREKGEIPEDKMGRATILGVNNTIVP